MFSVQVEVFWVVMPCSMFILKMEAAWSSETLVFLSQLYTVLQPRWPRLES